MPDAIPQNFHGNIVPVVNPLLETAPGQQRAWNILEKLGEGDAGEVHRVQALLDGRIAIMKRPRKNNFPSDAIRQANQIAKEAQTLALLNRLNAANLAMQPPALLDQAKQSDEFSERFFIVITPAPGINLAQLARSVRMGSVESVLPGSPDSPAPPALELLFLKKLIGIGRLPELLLLRSLSGLLNTFETIHTFQGETAGGQVFGIIWNDVKPEHIYWSAVEARFTLIDWGNAQFLEADGVTRDRLNSRINDYQQFLNSMGRFLEDEAPDLLIRLEWPVDRPTAALYSESIQPLYGRIEALLAYELEQLAETRCQENEILSEGEYTLAQFERLANIHARLVAAGELPNYAESERFFFQVARTLASGGDLEAVEKLFRTAGTYSSAQPDGYGLLGQVAAAVSAGSVSDRVLFYGLAGDWESAFWDLRQSLLGMDANQRESAPSLLGQAEDISDLIRIQALGQDSLRPRVALNRLIYTLQSSIRDSSVPGPGAELLQALREEILPRWTLVEPDPPNSGIGYRELDAYIEALETAGREAARQFLLATGQPRLQADVVLDAWERKDFETARLGLRQLLLWDPDWARVFLAERALVNAPTWLATIAAGPVEDEPLQEFITRLEVTGREYRNQVGPATWLDALLDAFKQLRRGGEPTDILVQHMEARDELSWLVMLESRRPLLATPGRSLQVERLPLPEIKVPILGMKETPLGGHDGVLLSEPLDTWTAEARGSSARLFMGRLPIAAGESIPAAMKLMRPDRVDYALPLFNEEVRILTLMRDTPGVVPMLECGFIHLNSESKLPGEERGASAEGLVGEVQRFGPDSVHNFLGDLEKRVGQGWIPYLALEKQERQDNLLLHCDTGHTHGRFLPILEGLIMALQICDILEVAHTRDIVYRDHKILHYYWRSEYNGVMMIDWNVAKRHPGGLSEAEIRFDLVQFGARALHYILTGRSAPGALPMGPNRPEEIEAAQSSYTAQWTYDDQRLPKDIKDLLETVLAAEYRSARAMRDTIFSIYQKLSELV